MTEDERREEFSVIYEYSLRRDHAKTKQTMSLRKRKEI